MISSSSAIRKRRRPKTFVNDHGDGAGHPRHLIKAPDHLCVPETALRPDKRRRIARETLEIYSPLAHRLGIHHIKTELEELGFEALYANRYRVIKEVVKAARGNRKEMIQKILSEIEGRLQEAGIPCRVSGDRSHLCSICRKMV